jgi:hypothetical protein
VSLDLALARSAKDGEFRVLDVSTPEPATLALVAVGLAALVAWTRRRRALAG